MAFYLDDFWSHVRSCNVRETPQGKKGLTVHVLPRRQRNTAGRPSAALCGRSSCLHVESALTLFFFEGGEKALRPTKAEAEEVWKETLPLSLLFSRRDRACLQLKLRTCCRLTVLYCVVLRAREAVLLLSRRKRNGSVIITRKPEEALSLSPSPIIIPSLKHTEPRAASALIKGLAADSCRQQRESPV